MARYGIPIPTGRVADSAEAARDAATDLSQRVVVKAQVLTGGRGKAGGVRVAETPDSVASTAASILSMTIKGLPVRQVLVEDAVAIHRELYLGLVIDRKAQRPVIMASAAGGVDIEETARTAPEKIHRLSIDPCWGLHTFQARRLAIRVGLEASLWPAFADIARNLVRAFIDCDASLAEINPLVCTTDGKLLALDAKMVLDDNALYRHPDLESLRDEQAENVYERLARQHRLSYVKLDGAIGCMVNGAGLAMAIMDLTQLFGGAPANFLDIGGGAQAERVEAALDILLSDPNVRAVLINIFGGITRCDEVARGIVAALHRLSPQVPIVVRLVGTNEELAREILAEANVVTAKSLVEVAERAVAAARTAAAPA